MTVADLFKVTNSIHISLWKETEKGCVHRFSGNVENLPLEYMNEIIIDICVPNESYLSVLIA